PNVSSTSGRFVPVHSARWRTGLDSKNSSTAQSFVILTLKAHHVIESCKMIEIGIIRKRQKVRPCRIVHPCAEKHLPERSDLQQFIRKCAFKRQCWGDSRKQPG